MFSDTGLITKEEVRDFYDGAAARVDVYRKKNAYYYSLLRRTLQRIIPEGRRILDLGCGQGDMLDDLKPSCGIGVDISREMIDRARAKYPHLTFIEGDIESSPVQQGSFDFILLCNSIGFLEDVQKAFKSMKMYAGPETRIVITHYNYLWEPLLKLGEFLNLKMKEPYQNWLSIDDIGNLLTLEGFEVVRKRQSVLLPKKVPLLSSFCNRILANLPLFWRMALVEVIVARPVSAEGDKEPSCSVIVPARNEKGTIESLVRRLPEMGSRTEIIFVEGHSADGTLEEMRRVKDACPQRDIKVLVQDGEGKADAVRKGLGSASGDVLIILDADLTVWPEELPKFFRAVASGTGELVIGSRLVYQLRDESMRFLNLLGNKFFSLLFSFLLGQRIKDTLCGTKALSRTHYDRISRRRAYLGDIDPFGDFDLIFGATMENLKILEVPVRYHPRQYGETQIRRFYHGMLLVRMVWIASRKLKFVY